MEGSKRLPVSGVRGGAGFLKTTRTTRGLLLAVIPSIHLLLSWESSLGLRSSSPGSLLETRRKKKKKKILPGFSVQTFFFFSPPLVQSFNYLKGEVLFPHSKLSRLFLPLVVKVEAAAQAISGVCDVFLSFCSRAASRPFVPGA